MFVKWDHSQFQIRLEWILMELYKNRTFINTLIVIWERDKINMFIIQFL